MENRAIKIFAVVIATAFGIASFYLSAVVILVGFVPLASGAIDGRVADPAFLFIFAAIILFLTFVASIFTSFATRVNSRRRRLSFGLSVLIFILQMILYVYV
ncbi:hypothetical protein [Streptomyces sp. NBC_00887]|uniref:hypothetical protein n=1 Tax=Streptomyces sp. NBC_00887 TaxID=2975859 RepID=UPI00386FEF3C|nr:hypothetical protein OG844_35015 [Streptomyces sp. NBC_00887]